MRILHLCAALPRDGGGMGELVSSFVREQAKAGYLVSLVFAQGSEQAVDSTALAAQIRCFRRSFPEFLYFSWGHLFRLPGIVYRADVVHVYSNWTFLIWYACGLALLFRKVLVMSPHGCLDTIRFRHSVWKKKFVGALDRFFL